MVSTGEVDVASARRYIWGRETESLEELISSEELHTYAEASRETKVVEQ